MSNIYQQLSEDYRAGGMVTALETATQTLRRQNRFHELFEVLKMQTRQRLGLPLLHDDASQLSEVDQRRFEDELLEACRDVGFSLMRAGQVQESWGYLKHLTDRKAVLAELNQLEVTDDNLEAIVGLLLYEGLDCDRGFQLVLEKYGTCNAITTMQNAMYGRSQADRRATGNRLVQHVHHEVLESVKAHVEREEGAAPSGNRLSPIIANRDFLFENGSYHIDTSHLSSTVQIAVELVDTDTLTLALDLARYGTRLHPELQYPSQPPFEDTYPSHLKFFAALLGEDVDANLSYFRQRADQTDAHQEGTFVIETYIDLLARLGRPADAIEEVVRLIPAGIQTTGRAPTLYDLSKQQGCFDRYRELCIEREDLLGFVVGLEQ